MAASSDPLLFEVAWWTLPVSGLLFLLGAAVGGVNFLPGGLRSLRHLRLDMHVLMSVAIVGAVVIAELAEAAAIAALFSLAELLEDFSVNRARRSLRELITMTPSTARVKTENGVEERNTSTLQVGVVVVVRAGERLAVDGIVLSGNGWLDQSPVTGESMPVERTEGDPVYAGSVLDDGYIEIETSRAFGESTLHRIIRLVQEAESNRAPVERFVDRFARWYTPVVVLMALLVVVVPPLAFGASFSTWFLRGLTLLVIACPCALVISTPVSVVSALTAGARHGVLIKGGAHLEALGTIRGMAFDKTGTLTVGRPSLSGVHALDRTDRSEAFRIAAALESRSAHPIARAVVAGWEAESKDDGSQLPEVRSFTQLTGKGVEGVVEGAGYRLGRPVLFELGPAALSTRGRGCSERSQEYGYPAHLDAYR
jgi:Cd2+/Zn2+-exporting ATPase